MMEQGEKSTSAGTASLISLCDGCNRKEASENFL